jgi:hypothetical protein
MALRIEEGALIGDWTAAGKRTGLRVAPATKPINERLATRYSFRGWLDLEVRNRSAATMLPDHPLAR